MEVTEGMGQKCLLISLFLVLLLSMQSASALGPEVAGQPVRQKLIVGVMSTPPYSMKDEDGNWSGITVDLWKEIATAIDVDYQFKEVDLKGLLSGLEDGTIDVGASGVSITSAREDQIDFSDPYLATVEAVAVNTDQQPNLVQLFRSTFLNWTTLRFLILVLILPLAGAAVLWILEHKGDSEHYSGKTKKAFGRSLFWSTIVLAGKEFPKSIGWSIFAPATFAGRLFGVLWMVVGIMLISLFTATVASLLTTKQLEGIVHDPDDLLHVTVGTVANSVGYEYLKHRRIKCNHLYSGAAEMLQALSDHKCDAVVFNRHIMVYYARNMYLNKIDVLHFPLRQDFLAIPLRTGSPMKESINRALLHLVEGKKWQTIVSTYLGNDWANSDSM